MSETLTQLYKRREEEKIASIIETYGMGFDDFYKDGKYDGKIEAKVETVKNCFEMGIDEDTISQITGFSINLIREIKKDL